MVHLCSLNTEYVDVCELFFLKGLFHCSFSLVRQQLDSFDEFINNTIQEIVEDSRPILAIGDPWNQDGTDVVTSVLFLIVSLATFLCLGNSSFFFFFERTKVEIKFGQVYVIPPAHTEANGTSCAILPSDCRLRHFT